MLILFLLIEINRAPAKVQAALLEAMQEATSNYWIRNFHLENHFLYLQTQNPIEQEGTYRFTVSTNLIDLCLKIDIHYPNKQQKKNYSTEVRSQNN